MVHAFVERSDSGKPVSTNPKERRVNGRKTLLSNSELARITVQASSRRTAKWTAEEDAALLEAIRKHGEAWTSVAAAVASRNSVQCNVRWNRSLRPGLVRGKWSPEEDAKLLEALAAQQGSVNVDWPQVALSVQGRISKQCKERFRLKLDPELKREEWTSDEDALLLASFDKHNGRWADMVSALPGRRAGVLKVRFRALQRQASDARPWTMEEDVALITHVLAPQAQVSVKRENAVLAKRSTHAKNERFKALCDKHPLVMRAVNCKGSLLEHEARRLLAIGAPAATADHALSAPAISARALSCHSASSDSTHLGSTSLSSSRLSRASQSTSSLADASSGSFGKSLVSSLVKGQALRSGSLSLYRMGTSESTYEDDTEEALSLESWKLLCAPTSECRAAPVKRLRTFAQSSSDSILFPYSMMEGADV